MLWAIIMEWQGVGIAQKGDAATFFAKVYSRIIENEQG